MAGIGATSVPSTSSGGGGGSVTQGTSPWVDNITQIGGIAIALGQTTMSVSLPVTIASNQTSFPVAATLNAETTKVIGTIRVTGNIGAVFDGAVGAAVPANVLYVGMKNSSSQLSPLNAALSQGDAQTGENALNVAGDSFNGSTYDRNRIVLNATDSVGTGIQAVGVLAQFDDVSPGTVTENRFGNVRMSVRREMYQQIRDAAGNERGANVDASNRLSITLDNIAAALTLATVTTVTTVATVTNLAQMNGAAISMGVGATGTGVQRVVLASDAGKTLVSKGGSASSSGDNTLVVAGSTRLKVYAFSLSTVSTTAVTCIFQSGASGTELWRVILQTPASVAGGANLVVQPPAWLFATASATLLNLNLSAAVAVNWSVSYFDEA